MKQNEVAGDVISGKNVTTIEGYASLNFEAAIVSSFRENQNQPFVQCIAQTTVGPLKPHFRSQGAQMSNRLRERK